MRKKLGEEHRGDAGRQQRRTSSSRRPIRGSRSAGASREQTRVELAEPLAGKDIRWVPQTGRRRSTRAASTLTLADGSRARLRLPRDRTGPKLAFEEVPGLGPNGHTQSVCTQAHALAAWDATRSSCRIRARSWSARRQGASCFGPAYEIRDDPRRGPAQAQDARPRADDLRHQRALHRSHGPRRRRRQQGTDGVGAAPAAHQLDHQREGHRRRGRRR